MRDEDHFFGRSNLHKALWSILLGIVCFGAGTAWKAYTGKEKIIVATTDDGAKPIVVRVLPSPDDPALSTVRRLDALLDEVRHLRDQTVTSRRSEPSSIPPLVRSPSRTNNVSQALDSQTLNAPLIPEFRLPSAVKGYVQADLAGFGRASCPPRIIRRDDSLMFRMSLSHDIAIEDFTPIFLSVVRPTAPNQETELLSRQFVLQDGINQFRIQFAFPPGLYRLTVGFYARAELDQKYPNLYGLFCEVVVQQ